MLSRKAFFSFVVISCVAFTAAGAPGDFGAMSGYPAVGGTVVADALGDGRFILYDGDGVYIENAVDAGTFTLVASGYAGDPAFIAVAPDGHRCLLGAGAAGTFGAPADDWIWQFDANSPADAGASGMIALENNYWGVWLDNDTAMIEAGPGYVGEIGILEVSTKTYQQVVNKGESSAALVLDQGYVYSQSGFGAATGELRRFLVEDLIDIFDVSGTPLDWTDGVVVGIPYTGNTGGPGSIDADGVMAIGGWGMPGTVLYVDAATGDVVSGPITVSSGAPSSSVSAFYNPVTKRTLVTETNWDDFTFNGYIASEDAPPMPAAGMAGLAALAGLMTVIARRKLNR